MAMGDRAFMQVLFEKEAGLSALPLQMQEALTQRAVLIGGASGRCREAGRASIRGSAGRQRLATGSRCWATRSPAWSSWRRDLKARLERIPRVRDVDINAGELLGAGEGLHRHPRPRSRRAGRATASRARDFAAAVTREVRGPVGAPAARDRRRGDPGHPQGGGRQGADPRRAAAALVPNAAGAPVRIGDLATVEEREALGTHHARGPAVRPDRGLRLPRAQQARQADPRRLHGVDLGAAGLHGERPAVRLRPRRERQGALAGVRDRRGAGGARRWRWCSTRSGPRRWWSSRLPIALAGVVAAFWVTGTAFTREAAVGVILVVGLAVNQAILLVHGALERRGSGAAGQRGSLSGADVVRIARDRSAMIVLVTLTTVASLLPLGHRDRSRQSLRRDRPRHGRGHALRHRRRHVRAAPPCWPDGPPRDSFSAFLPVRS